MRVFDLLKKKENKTNNNSIAVDSYDVVNDSRNKNNERSYNEYVTMNISSYMFRGGVIIGESVYSFKHTSYPPNHPEYIPAMDGINQLMSDIMGREVKLTADSYDDLATDISIILYSRDNCFAFALVTGAFLIMKHISSLGANLDCESIMDEILTDRHIGVHMADQQEFIQILKEHWYSDSDDEIIDKVFDFLNDNSALSSNLFNRFEGVKDEDDNEFVVENGILKRYIGNKEYVTIPDYIRIIGEGAFKNCSSIISVDIADSVECIESGAFYKCTSLVDIYIPNSVTVIGMRAFWGCSSLKDIFIPITITRIESAAFEECSSLTQVNIPGSVNIASYTFYNCTSLSRVYIADSNEDIGIFYGAFEGCTSLVSINIPNSVIQIDAKAFKGCTLLENIIIPNTVRSIGFGAFQNCVRLKEVRIPKSVKRIEMYAFENCQSATIIVSESIEKIGEDAFEGCKEVIYKKENVYASDEIQFNKKSAQSDKYVFISYSTRNQNYAEAAFHLLKDEGVGVWMAPYDIPAGSKYAHVINNAIKNCSCALLLLSEQSQASVWVDKEIERACNYKKTVISMHLDDSQLNDSFSFYLGNQQIVPVKTINIHDENVQKVINAIKSFTR